jgi:transmembrane sensor
MAAWMVVSPVLRVLQPDEGIMRLPDGSRVELAARTQLDVRYTDRTRALDLQSGAAYFTVAPNKDQPFIVTAGDLRVRALGTAFNIRRAANRTVLTVTEGKVEITRLNAEGAPTQARAGEQLTYDHEGPAPRVTSADTDAALAWREGRLEYIREPLEAVIADLNRYTVHPVVIADEAAKALRFSGTVLTANTQEWIAALPGILPLTVQNENGVDIIRSRP